MSPTPALSSAKVARLHDIMAGHVERGHPPGLVSVVSRRGESHVDVIGATVIGGLVMATRIPLSSFGVSFTAGLLLTLAHQGRVRQNNASGSTIGRTGPWWHRGSLGQLVRRASTRAAFPARWGRPVGQFWGVVASSGFGKHTYGLRVFRSGLP